jgi:hypothetical protein
MFLCFSDISDGWNRHAGFGSFQLSLPGRSDLPSWRFNVDAFASHHVSETEFPVYRAPSTYPGAGFGMFASRFLHRGEVVAEYTGTWTKMTHDGLLELTMLHEDDGNGIVELDATANRPRDTARNSAQSSAVWCLDPYDGLDGPRKSVEVPGIWANHRCIVNTGCNLKLQATGYANVIINQIISIIGLPTYEDKLCTFADF